MAWHFSAYLLPTFTAGGVTTLLAAYAWGKRDTRAALPFTVMMVGLAIWSVGYGIELGFTTLKPMLFWDRVAFIGSVIVPTAWLLLAVEYAGYDAWLTRTRVGLLTVEPLVTLALVWTNEFHGLIWRHTALDSTGAITKPQLTFGPGYWANFGYSYLLFFVGVVLFVHVMIRASRLHRRQSLFMILGGIGPLGVNVVFHVVPRANPVGNLDLTTFALSVSSVCFALALFRFRMLELAPAARETLIEGMSDGVLVLDAEERIVDFNPTVRRVLGGGIAGQSVAATEIGSLDSSEREVVSFEVGERTRTYEASKTLLTDFRGESVGSFVLLRDITELRTVRDHEQRLSVLNRILRHNIRNELTVIRGHSEALSESLSDERREHVEAIDRASARILDISEKADHVPTTVRPKRGGVAANAAAITRRTADQLAEAHPTASVHVDAPEAAWASVVGRKQLAVAVTNLGENALKHNPADGAAVWFRITERRRTVRISIRDNGPGVPAGETAVITSDRETPLEHGSGLGLWIARWIVEASDGDLSVETGDSTGSVFSIDLPRTAPSEDAPTA